MIDEEANVLTIIVSGHTSTPFLSYLSVWLYFKYSFWCLKYQLCAYNVDTAMKWEFSCISSTDGRGWSFIALSKKAMKWSIFNMGR